LECMNFIARNSLISPEKSRKHKNPLHSKEA
jgi:hypothetical protein